MKNNNIKGQFSISSENILPIIKKWLYSEADIFLRELVSNAADAINKLQRLSAMGEANIDDNEEFYIRIILDRENKKITIEDNGIGMTTEEIERYINQIAFSGATDFINKYKDSIGEESGIIGHFGLGFYSAFMAADSVEIDTLSYKKDAQPANWSCDGGIEFEMKSGTKTKRGTSIILHIADDAKDFLEDYKLRTVIKKYCSFLPVNIFFENAAAKDGGEKEPINNTKPLWIKKASECNDSDYKQFYSQLFSDFNEPLFWIHLNMDYPFRLKGILYFPRFRTELDAYEGQVKLFSNQVFVADNIKEVIPEYLLLLKGVVDCPDLPLNVSRSFLQNDEYVKKMSNYIVKKVADKLMDLVTNHRQEYEGYWDFINQFIKYVCVRQSDFYPKCRDAVLYKTTDNKYLTLNEYLERNEATLGKKVIFTDDTNKHRQYIKMFAEQKTDIAVLGIRLDVPFINIAEGEDVSFIRIDAKLDDSLKEEDGADYKQLFNKFASVVGGEFDISVQKFKSPDLPAVVLFSEEGRRKQEMGVLYGINLPSEDTLQLIINSSNELVKAIVDMQDSDKAKLICSHVVDLSLMNHKPIDGERADKFIERNMQILKIVAES